MVTKILSPKSSGEIIYDNRGSSSRLINYLQHEAKENKGNKGQETVFFNQSNVVFSAKEVQEKIDNNVKGLHQKESRFHSLIISPSQDELKHLANDSEKLKAYTQQVMENYAGNFNLKNDKKLDTNNLVWFATVHETRKFSGTDHEVKEGNAKSGDLKEGLQTHIHVIISARDKEMKITLNPNGHKSRFSQADWTKNNIQDFNKTFQYQPKESQNINQKEKKERNYKSSDEKKLAYLIGKTDDMMKRHSLWEEDFDWRKIAKIGQERGFSKEFYEKLKALDTKIGKENEVPEDYLKDLGNSKNAKEQTQSINPKNEKEQIIFKKEVKFDGIDASIFSFVNDSDGGLEELNRYRKYKMKKPKNQQRQSL